MATSIKLQDSDNSSLQIESISVSLNHYFDSFKSLQKFPQQKNQHSLEKEKYDISKNDLDNSYSSELERLKSNSLNTVKILTDKPVKENAEQSLPNLNLKLETDSKSIRLDKNKQSDDDGSTLCACSDLDSIKTEDYCNVFNKFITKNGKFKHS